MIDLEQAFRTLMEAISPLPAETVPTWEAAGRVAAADVVAPQDVPGFARVMMDGYACRAADIAAAAPEHPVALRLSGEVNAGRLPAGGPGPGEAWTVVTGAVLPPGADVVVPLERVRREGDRVLVRQPLPRGRHVAAPDEDMRRGDRLVEAGEPMGPAAVSALVAAGIASVRVVRRPRVLVLATGDELADLRGSGEEPPDQPQVTGPGEVYNSNAAALAADLQAAGMDCTVAGIVPDDPEALRAAFQRALAAGTDVILTTGGVSVGPRDRVARVWIELGARRLLGRIDVKPGGPFFAGRCGDTWVIGLSGSPASCLATYQVLVRPFLLRLAGRRRVVRPVVPAVLAAPFPKPADRPRLLWARLRGGTAPYEALLPGAGEGRLTAIARSNALLWMPRGTPPLEAGARLPALRLDLPEDRETLDWFETAGSGRPLSAGGGGEPRAAGGNTPAAHPGGELGGELPVVAVTGPSGAGKTQVLAGLIRRLAQQGVRVVALKHAAHGFELDRPGTDSQRLAAAGAAVVGLAGPQEGALLLPSLPAAAGGSGPSWRAWVAAMVAAHRALFGSAPGLVLVEGFTESDLPKIVVGRPKVEPVRGEVIAWLPAGSGEQELDRLASRLLDLLPDGPGGEQAGAGAGQKREVASGGSSRRQC
ncbi:MAG TPA: gephyrin-like molybdotransferase Glp [Thermaerobacter sp.]